MGLQSSPADWEIVGAASMGQKPEEADSDEAQREHVQEESPEEFVGADRHGPRRTSMCVVLPPKRHLVFGHIDNPMIRDGDVCV